MTWWTFTKNDPNNKTVAAPTPNPAVDAPKPAAPIAAPPVQTPSLPSTGVTYGLDVSHYEPVMDYPKAFAAGKRFVYAKATDGDSGGDAKFTYHRTSSKAAGLIFGAFCFNRFDADPVKQASHFMQTIGEIAAGELPPCLDLEWDRFSKNAGYHDGGKIDDTGAAHALVTLKELERLSGMTPVWYTHHFFFAGVAPSLVKEFARYPLWLTQPGAKTPTLPAGLTKVAFFQNTFHEKGLAAQNPDGIDADIFYGSLDQLKALTKQ
jgi:lysozyme